MNDFWPVLQAIATSLVSIAGAIAWARRQARQAVGSGRLEVLSDLRERLEVAEAKNLILAGRNGELESRLQDTEHDLDTCARQRDDAYSELRGVRTRRGPRT